jgi:hypothetical protein
MHQHTSFGESIMNRSPRLIILFLSAVIALLIIIASGGALLSRNFYFKETFNWAIQAKGQDAIDLFLITPLLIVTSILAYRKKRAILLWSGIIFYLVYTYIIYCLAFHFNKFFIVYCITLGLSFYLFIYFLFSQVQQPAIKNNVDKKVRKPIGIYFIAVACLFYLLWLSEIVPAVTNGVTPASLNETGLLTNPVHAIDLSVCLPALFITGLFLLRKNMIGSLLTPAMLVFCILMDVTIGTLIILMKSRGVGGDYSVAIVMFLLALISMVLLIWFMKKLEIVPNKD